MTKVRVLGPIEIEYERKPGGRDLQPLETSLIVALALGADDSQGGRHAGDGDLGGLTDVELGRAVWNNANSVRNVQRAINQISSTTSISFSRVDSNRRRFLSWPAHELDYHLFADLVTEARGLDETRAIFEALEKALELVRGAPLDGLALQPTGWLRRKVTEMTAEVCDAAALWLQAAILLNEKWSVLDRACQIHRWFPADETLCQYVAYLLYRAGRRARALDCLNSTRVARDGSVSPRLTKLSKLIEAHGDVVLATESLNLTIPSTGKPFQHRFSFAEIGEFLARLLGEDTGQRQVISTTPNTARQIEYWRPDLIVGINRGGSIVGGMICKRLDLCRVLPIIILWRTDPSGQREYYVAGRPACEADHPGDDPGDVRRILITDDAFRTGNHVRLARAELREMFPRADIRVAALISVRQDVSYGEGPGRGEIGGPTYYGELVGSRGFELPWDATATYR